MTAPVGLTAYDLAVGALTAVGVLYFLLVQSTIVEYRRFLVVAVAGLLGFLVGGPVAALVAPGLVHWVHGLASVLVALGLYVPVKRDVRRDGWASVLLREPSQVRDPADWMLPVDDEILHLFDSTDLVLTPAVVSLNIDYSRDEVNRRLVELDERGFVTKVDRGKYRITALGRQYLDGDVPGSLRSQLRHAWEATFSG